MSLLPLVKKAQKNNPEAMLMILKLFERKIYYELKQTTSQEREDLSQDLYLKMIETVQNYSLDQTPGFWEFIYRDEMSDKTMN